MSELITRTARLVPYLKRPKQVASFVTAYSYEPLADDPGAELGNLYVVMEVLVSGRASEEVADLIIETIGDRYYNHAGSGSALERFEASIKSANQELSEHVNRGNAAWIGKLSAVIAVQVDDELHLAQTGSAEAFLYRGKAASHISSSGPNRPTTPNKTFGSIASGQLEAGDRILLATPALVHQVPLARLQAIISQSGPNAAIAEITDLLKGASIDRIAGLVIELTTPELAALQVRSEQPNEIRLGSPENALEAARLAAAPIAQTTITSSKKVVHVAQTSIKHAQPRAKAIGQALAGLMRRLLSTSRGRKISFISIIVVTLATILVITLRSSSAQAAKTFDQYQQAYTVFASAQQLLDAGNKTEARGSFLEARRQLLLLSKQKHTIDGKLAHTTLPASEPHSYNGLLTLVGDRLDQIDGLVKVQPTTVTSFSRGSHIDHFELFADKAYAFDSGDHGSLQIISTINGATKLSTANIAKIGQITATTLSGSGDGIFILTSKPSIWLYRFDNDSLTEQQIAYGQWPKATAVASYASNLYLLGTDAIYKHVKTSTGYSPKSEYMKLTSEESAEASGLTVDGSIYLISPSGLHRYIASTLKQSAPAPDGLGLVHNLRSLNGGSIVIGTSPTSKRVGLWRAQTSTLSFAKQVSINDIKSIYDASYDQKSNTLYALVDGRLIRASVQL